MIFGKFFARTHNIEFQKRGYENYVKQAVRIIVQQQQQTLEAEIELLNDHPTNNNEHGINMKRKHQAILRNLLQKNSPPWGKFSGDTKGILILPGSV